MEEFKRVNAVKMVGEREGKMDREEGRRAVSERGREKSKNKKNKRRNGWLRTKERERSEGERKMGIGRRMKEKDEGNKIEGIDG